MTAFAVPWTPALALQADDLDKGHHSLLNKLNALLGAIASQDELRVRMAFGALTSEAQAHFAAEEKLMRELGYPDQAEHDDHHRRLLQKLAELRYTVCTVRNFADLGARASLERWLVPHLTNDDKKLADFLAAQAPPSPAVA